MPRNGSGVYSLPAGYLATTGQAATATQHNTPLEDIASEITASLPTAGTKAMSGNLQMGSNKITGMADGSATTDGATVANINTSLAAYMPAGVIVPYGGTTEPTGWLFCYGQAISRTTYATLFAAISTTYGTGDGSTTFNLPDLRGRVVAGQDDMGGSSANRLTNTSGGLNGDTLGATGGAETHTLTTAELAVHSHANSLNDPGHAHVISPVYAGVTAGAGSARNNWDNSNITTSAQATGITITNANAGSGSAHNNVQPTIILNYIIRT
jgi:microcystin-dependent protein